MVAVDDVPESTCAMEAGFEDGPGQGAETATEGSSGLVDSVAAMALWWCSKGWFWILLIAASSSLKASDSWALCCKTKKDLKISLFFLSGVNYLTLPS
jgi:hypothetical protein